MGWQEMELILDIYFSSGREVLMDIYLAFQGSEMEYILNIYFSSGREVLMDINLAFQGSENVARKVLRPVNID